MKLRVFEISSLFDLNNLVELNKSRLDSESNRERLRCDFERGFYRVIYALDENSVQENDYELNSILGYALFYNSYSTWQNRVMYISEIWFKSDCSYESRHLVLKALVEKLFSMCRQNNYQRINFNLKFIEENENLIKSLVSDDIGALNLTKSEQWLLFELSLNDMKLFKHKSNAKIDPRFQVKKVNDITQYCHQIRDLIKELAIYENLEDQFNISIDGMKQDYNHQSRQSFDKTKAYLNRFYEAMVVVKQAEDTNDELVVGFAVYYMNYDLNRGRGSYLEDLYIKENYRGKGLGTYLWGQVIEDCLLNHQVNFMQWSCLEWNTSAIDFYYKYNATNLTKSSDNLYLFRFITEKIYSK